MDCVSSVSFFVLNNGTPSAEIVLSKGLRQSYLISPYLFLVVAEALSGFIRLSLEEGSPWDQYCSNNADYSHLLFGDDCVLDMLGRKRHQL